MPHWSEIDFVALLTAVGIAALIFSVLLGLRAGIRRFASHIEKKMAWPVMIDHVARKTGLWFLAAVAVQATVGYTNVSTDLKQAVHALFVIAFVLQAAIWSRALIISLVEHRAAGTGSDESNLTSAIGLIRLLVSVGVFTIAGILILDNLGVNVTGLVAGLGIGGIAIGLAAQGIFSDLFAALSIIFDKPFRVGDVITYTGTEGPVTGTVEEIGLKSTRVRSLTGELRVIGNAQLLAQEVSNYAGRNLFRLHLVAGVTYQTPPDVADSIPGLMQDLAEKAGHRFIRSNFTGFGASSIDFELYFEADVDNVAEAQAAYQRVAMNLLRAFHERKIEFAYPTQTNFTAAPDGSIIMPYPTETVSERSHS
ncbi:mechanosensitive ion channel family protein [Croceicoccus naphthovorans]|uniref:Small-conductance mechanosensitive channel n=1 Tax=Croceicoccus naphthovorans TaxID=1348774 RepID=A0A0G3XEN5_9SPHN|nr:mechanosensitive ion channel domain-containing protein [Croceicoccus naphthovorans]AKM09086.1 hypothetical protein AB433_02490 [Croceicoccus naphthovorans]MBB3991673.1 small-conductance mechanosensitive channel [Croceicoccus naphthovorans]